jgi:hypothetical protein
MATCRNWAGPCDKPRLDRSSCLRPLQVVLIASVLRNAFGGDVWIACFRNLRVSNLVVGIGLLTTPAFGQPPSGTLVAQITGSTPPAGVLITPQPAPVAVPPSGVLTGVERSADGAHPFKTTHRKKTTRGRPRRHTIHASRASTTPAAPVNESPAESPLMVKTTPEQPSQVGPETFFPPFGKGKN